MSYSYVNSSVNSGTIPAIPAHKKYDLIMVFAVNKTSNTAPSPPVGVTTIGGPFNFNNPVYSGKAFYRIATSDSDTIGAFTNTDVCAVIVYRHNTHILSVYGWSEIGKASTSIIYRAWPLPGNQTAIPGSMIFSFASSTANIPTQIARPSPFTTRNIVSSVSLGTYYFGDLVGVSSAVLNNLTGITSQSYISYTLNVYPEVKIPGGVARPRPIFRSGVVQ